jgi:hypothetical protein
LINDPKHQNSRKDSKVTIENPTKTPLLFLMKQKCCAYYVSVILPLS